MSTIITPPSGFTDEVLLQQLATQHTALQQMWLSGYLYALAVHAQGLPADAPLVTAAPALSTRGINGKATQKVTVLFGSQTGNSKKVAGQVAIRIRESG